METNVFLIKQIKHLPKNISDNQLFHKIPFLFDCEMLTAIVPID